ncbi:MAG: hypothetical protein ACRCWW_05505 [Scandinavium sp.]|uniref:hypothetical protein n=1 Tax=Scandinavium sp. TaxID=2830653 RepID=UPI003F3B817E
MSKRSDIIEPYEWGPTTKTGLVYSEILGWIDLGHAQGNDISALVANISEGQQGYQDFYTVSYGQNMRMYQRKLGTGKFVRWRIKKGLSLTEIHSVALAMMFSCAGIFENYQARWFFSWYTDSGFSGEDLTSDLLGFYRAIMPMNYPSRLKLVSKESALRRWDHYGPIGKYKNKGFLPLLFPDRLC